MLSFSSKISTEISNKDYAYIKLYYIREGEKFRMGDFIYTMIKSEYVKRGKCHVAFNGNTLKFTLFNDTNNVIEEITLSMHEMEYNQKYLVLRI